ncbi:hypothetical protein [Pseudoalteromonas sp. OANN1]|uniref:hypothetical protein n=1 Tax=Pseudoalteromonas sp. OANN1 TaxID=2954497 RepID=UPI002097895D|nr:hypothetical protein [Pseudoalteromonas sp. OANN1]MCO7199599.1 hypothetical protein [Pseudoalteromonas sp. OANN1]
MQEKIKINSHYTRSVNLERDHASGLTISSYIPTSRAKRMFERVIESFNENNHPRAWSLVGPYGSGKSSFSVFLSHLLGNPELQTTQNAFKVLESNNIPQAEHIKSHTADSSGYIRVLISGSPEPLCKRVLRGLEQGAQEYFAHQKGKAPKVLSDIEEANTKEVTASDVVQLFTQLQNTIKRSKTSKARGILLVIDELGKFLEYEARHYGANDIYLLQQLAEKACEGHECNLLMFVLLHQSFEQYAKGLGEALKNEWAKIQGRFEEVPFLESTEQTLKVVSKAIVNQIDEKTFLPIAQKIEQFVEILHENDALPSVLGKSEAIDLFKNCYPLHPITALILPFLCQKLAQNERTLFNFLGSSEEYGFCSTLKELDFGDFILPDVVFDYFVTNQSSVVTDHLTHRRWAEVVTALERFGDSDFAATRLLKSIGLFNIINAKGNFKAQAPLLETLAAEGFKESIAELVQKSIITFRAFNNEYRVWQGSDFDLEEELAKQQSLLGNFSLSEELNKAQILRPIVARKYTVENGALRFFVPKFTDAEKFKREAKQAAAEPRIVLYLAFGQDDIELFHKKVLHDFAKNEVVVLCKNSTQLKDAFAEVISLRKLEEMSQVLSEDPVAKREFYDRLNAAETTATKLVKSIEISPEDCEWYFNSEKQLVDSRRRLQEMLSSALYSIYKKAPSFHNELINKEKPSSQANAGRNKLLQRMLENCSSEGLGIEKFPPEKSMYLSILKQHGLHVKVDGEWKLSKPKKGSDLLPAWNCIEGFLDSAQHGNQKTLLELDGILMAPPYGIKQGVLPILYVHALLVKQHELAIFEDGAYIPELKYESIERLVKAPKFFKVESFKIEGLRASIFDGYKEALFDDSEAEKTILNIAKPLAKFINGLPNYTKKTRANELSERAQKLARAFEHAKSPQKLLFELLPNALGFESKQLDTDDKSVLTQFSKDLREVLTELKYHYSEVLKHEQELICAAFGLDKNMAAGKLRHQLAHYAGLEEYSVDVDGLKAFIRRLTADSLTDEAWLEGILTFLASKPPKEWNDADRSKAEFKLSDYIKRIAELEKLRLESRDAQQHIDGDFEVVLLKSLKKGVSPREQTVAIDKSKREAIAPMIKQIEAELEGWEKETKLALYAELVDGFLATFRQEIE